MPYYVYMLANNKHSRLTTYVGYTNNLKKRFMLKIEEVEIIKEEVTFKIPAKLN